MTPNFTLEELTRSSTADMRGISNEPGKTETANLQRLADTILQPLRDHIKQPIVITSGYRASEVNKIVGGSKRSQHMLGQAADIRVSNMSVAELVSIIDMLDLPYHQLINEFDSWVHVSIAPNGVSPRKQILHFPRKSK